jgi:hypothetical protein
MAAPASAIVAAVIGLNLLGDGLRDAFDPRRRLAAGLAATDPAPADPVPVEPVQVGR